MTCEPGDIGELAKAQLPKIVPSLERWREVEASMGMNTMDPTGMPEIPREVVSLRGAVDSLATRVQQLEEKLAPVLIPPSPHVTEKAIVAAPREPPSSGLASELAEQSSRLGTLEREVERLIYRIPL